jgi:hypothetical protein
MVPQFTPMALDTEAMLKMVKKKKKKVNVMTEESETVVDIVEVSFSLGIFEETLEKGFLC